MTAQEPLPPRARMGLLDYVASSALDEDYAHVAARRQQEGTAGGPVPAPGPRRPRWAATAVLVACGVLVATAAVQTARSAPLREQSRSALVERAQEGRDRLTSTREELLGVRSELDTLRRELAAAGEVQRSLEGRADRLGLLAGAVPATGPGVRVVADDAPTAATDRQVVLDTDLQILANGLWAAGAEAVAVDGQRLTQLSAIRVAGTAITVNYRPVSPPYTVVALGDPDELAARFLDSDAGSWWLNLRSVYGLSFAMTTESSLSVPAAPRLSLRHAAVPTESGRSSR